MLFIITCIILGVCCGIVLLIYNEIELPKLVTLSISSFLSIYIIVSGILFGLDIFSIMLSLCISLIVSLSILALLIMGRPRQKNKICINIKELIGVTILCVCVLPIIFQRNGYFCMAQDEGGYYVKALYLGEGINDNILKASEFETINSGRYSSYLQESIDDIVVGFHDPLHDLEYLHDAGIMKSHYDKYKEGNDDRIISMVQSGYPYLNKCEKIGEYGYSTTYYISAGEESRNVHIYNYNRSGVIGSEGYDLHSNVMMTQNGQDVWLVMQDKDYAVIEMDRQVLDVTGAQYVEGTNIQLYAANGSIAQRWKVITNGDGSFSLLANDERFALACGNVQLAEYHEEENSQKWWIE